MTYEEMLARARALLKPARRGEFLSFGFVAAVLEGGNGKYYEGVNIDLACGLGFCAERNAASSMVTDGELRVRRVVCVDAEGRPMPPCGCCREFLLQLSPENLRTEFLLGEAPQRIATLEQLLPFSWQEGREGDL